MARPWTEREERILVDGDSKGIGTLAIIDHLHREGFDDRTQGATDNKLTRLRQQGVLLPARGSVDVLEAEETPTLSTLTASVTRREARLAMLREQMAEEEHALANDRAELKRLVEEW